MNTKYVSPFYALCFLLILFTTACTPVTTPAPILTATKPSPTVTNTIVAPTASVIPTVAPTTTAPATPAAVSCFSENGPGDAVWSPDGTWIAVTSFAGVYLFESNLSNGKLFATDKPPTTIAFDPAGASLYVAIGDKVIRVKRDNQE